LRQFFLCEISRKKLHALERLAAEHRSSSRNIEVYEADFNRKAGEIIKSGAIRESTATFCLLDQHTFECAWATVETLARAKAGMKIELFYFVPTGWLQRALSALENRDIARKWWGQDDWDQLHRMPGQSCANKFCERFIQELGYKYAHAWPIYERKEGRRVMYYMVHATDHEEAPKLMNRAYRLATGQIQEHQLLMNFPTPVS
jgi:three-Cys-motif partner protein